MALWGSRRARRWRKQSEAELGALVAWARGRGWRADDGTHPELREAAERIVGLAGEPWDALIVVGGNPNWPGDGVTDFGAIATGPAAGGRALLLECWRESARLPRLVYAALSSAAAGTPFTFTVDAEGKEHVDGRAPELAGGAPASAALAGLAAPRRLRLIAGEIILCVPGHLAPDTAADLASRLASLDHALPRPPGSPAR